MLAEKQDSLIRSFLAFSSEASKILHIQTEQDYNDAIEMIEYLFAEAKDEADEPLNDLIDMISRSIEKYEMSQESIVKFHNEANNRVLAASFPLQGLEEKRWQDTLQALKSAREGKVVDGDKVHEWLESWGTNNELDPPKV